MRKVLAWVAGFGGIVFGFFVFGGLIAKIGYSYFDGYKFFGFTLFSETALSTILSSGGMYFVGIKAYRKIDKENDKSFVAFVLLCLFINFSTFLITAFLFFKGVFTPIEALLVGGSIIAVIMNGLEQLKIENPDELEG